MASRSGDEPAKRENSFNIETLPRSKSQETFLKRFFTSTLFCSVFRYGKFYFLQIEIVSRPY